MDVDSVPGGNETLLIVDDEEMLVELLRRMVERRGYKAIVASSGEKALAAYEANSDSIDLVITDLIMPGLDGKALARKLLSSYPDVRILVSTGFSAAADISTLLDEGVKGVVMKPYQSHQLLTKLREALDS